MELSLNADDYFIDMKHIEYEGKYLGRIWSTDDTRDKKVLMDKNDYTKVQLFTGRRYLNTDEISKIKTWFFSKKFVEAEGDDFYLKTPDNVEIIVFSKS